MPSQHVDLLRRIGIRKGWNQTSSFHLHPQPGPLRFEKFRISEFRRGIVGIQSENHDFNFYPKICLHPKQDGPIWAGLSYRAGHYSTRPGNFKSVDSLCPIFIGKARKFWKYWRYQVMERPRGNQFAWQEVQSEESRFNRGQIIRSYPRIWSLQKSKQF